MAGDAKTMIAAHLRALLEEVPALKPLTLVAGVDLDGRGDIQQFKVVLPDVTVTRDIGTDAKVRVEMPRAFFNAMVEHEAKIADWNEAYRDGRWKAVGNTQYLRLIGQVVEKQLERDRLRRATQSLRGHSGGS